MTIERIDDNTVRETKDIAKADVQTELSKLNARILSLKAAIDKRFQDRRTSLISLLREFDK